MRNATSSLVIGTIVCYTLLLLSNRETAAMPMFARKLGVSCATCHTTPPRLNETGYKFRAAGFRMPEMIGQQDERPFKLLDYSSLRLQLRYDAARSETGSVTSTSHRMRLQAVELYPFTGAWGEHFSSNFKLTFTPGEDPQLENAHVKFTTGKEDRFFTVRAGIFHPYDGYGASDTPATISRPLFQANAANFDQPTFFRTWGFDQLGVEAGFDHRRTSVRAAALNGLVLHREKGALRAYAAQGGPLTRSSPLPSHGAPDIQVFVNHRLHEEDGGVSLHYYHGNLALPAATPAGSFRNTFDRVAVYGSYPVKRLHLFAGFQHGRDRTAKGGHFTSRGFFAEASAPITELSAVGVRYDRFDPAIGKPHNEVSSATAYVNLWFLSQFRIVAEYQHRRTQRGAVLRQEDNALQARFIFIK